MECQRHVVSKDCHSKARNKQQAETLCVESSTSSIKKVYNYRVISNNAWLYIMNLIIKTQ